MSRSFKHTPIFADGSSSKKQKRFANKRVRKFKNDISNGKFYKKIYESYDIYDYISRKTFKESEESFNLDLKKYLNGGSTSDPRIDYIEWYDYNHWAKYFYRK